MTADAGIGGIGGDDGSVPAVRALALVVLVATAPVLAGCGALSGGGDDGDGNAADPTATATPGGAERVEQTTGVEPETIYGQVEDLLRVDAGSHPEIAVGDLSGSGDSADSDESVPPFYRLMLDAPENTSGDDGDNVTSSFQDGRITLDESFLETADPNLVELTIAAEYARQLLFQQGIAPEFNRPHHTQVYTLSVTLTAEGYDEQFLDGETFDPTPPAYEDESVTDFEWGYSAGMRYHVQQWMTERVESPTDVPRLYAGGLPHTGEQLLHGVDEGPRNVTVDLETNERWYREGGIYGRRGEIGTRAILRTQLDAETAAAAARGWGDDRYVPIQSLDDDAVGLVWVHRWDSPGEADEFAGAMETYLDGRRDEADDVTFEFRRVGDDATLLVASTGNMTENVDATYDAGQLNVSVGA